MVHNLTRFAREKYIHFAVRTLLKGFGVTLRSATEPIDDTSTGKFIEGVLAATAQFDNDVKWGTFSEARDAFKDGKADGVGIVLGNGLVGIDLDHCRDPQTGTIALQALTIIKQLNSYTETSPSGTGVHILVLGSLPPGRRRKGSIEMYGEDRYFTITGAHHPTTPSTIEDRTAELAAVHAEVLGSNGTNGDGRASAPLSIATRLDDQHLIDIARGASNGSAFSLLWSGDASAYPSPSEADLALCNHLAFYTGRDTARVDHLYRQCGLMREKWDARRGDSTYGTQTIRRAIADCREVYRPGGDRTRAMTIGPVPSEVAHGAGAERGVSLDDFHAYMPQHLYIFALSRELWPAASVNARLLPVPLVDQLGNPALNDNGTPKTIRPGLWLDKNRAVEQMTWAPGRPMLVRDRLVSEGGWIERPQCVVFNLYRPPQITPGDADKVGRWLDLVHRVYPDDSQHIIRWLAHRVQRPDEKINHALVLGGLQGVGKDTLLEPIKLAIGPWNFTEISPTHLLGRFNGFVKSVILRLSEARDLGEVDRYSFYERLKVYTGAPPDVLRVDEKNLREYAAFNVCGVVITTNHKTDGIYLPADDRRHFVAWSDLSKDDFTPEYWTELYRWYAQGGNEHVAACLATLDLGGFDVKAPPPQMLAFWDIVDANRAPEDAELADALEQLGSPAATTLTEVAGTATVDFAEWVRDRKNSRKIPHRMEAVGYVKVRNPDAKDGNWKLRGRRQVIYVRHVLSIRHRIEAARALVDG